MSQKRCLFSVLSLVSLLGCCCAGAEAIDLCTGVGACNRTWTTSGDALWYVQTAVNHDGINSLSSGQNSGGVSTLETTVNGPATVSFWWMVGNPAIDQGISFLVDGAGVYFNTSSDWTKFTHIIAAEGPHTLRWVFYPYLDGPTGYVDQFLVEENVPPTGTMVINGGAPMTASGNVTLSLAYNDKAGDASGVTKMRFSNNGSTWTLWEDPTPGKSWDLAPGDGYRTVRAQFRDKAGNISSGYTDYILVDTTPPTGSILINDGAPSTSNPEISLGLAWDDGTGSGVTRMRFSIDGATWTAWESLAATRPYTLPATPGYHTVRAQFRDRLGNVSTRYADFIRLLAR